MAVKKKKSKAKSAPKAKGVAKAPKASPGAKSFSKQKSLTKAFMVGLGANLVQFLRTGSARKGLRAKVGGTTIPWQSDDRSVPIPMANGVHTVTVVVSGAAGFWAIGAVSPNDSGGTDGTLPENSVGVFDVTVG